MYTRRNGRRARSCFCLSLKIISLTTTDSRPCPCCEPSTHATFSHDHFYTTPKKSIFHSKNTQKYRKRRLKPLPVATTTWSRGCQTYDSFSDPLASSQTSHPLDRHPPGYCTSHPLHQPHTHTQEMKFFESQHEFNYSWEEVSTANWRKYCPWNDKSTHVIAVDTLSRSVDPATGIVRPSALCPPCTHLRSAGYLFCNDNN